MDDLLIASKTFTEHLQHLEHLFDRLLYHGFTLKLSKSRFCKDQIPFLGFILSNKGISPDPDRLCIIRDFAEPKSKRQLQQFIGICNYYRQFAVHYAYFIDPLRDLLRGSVWKWTQKHSGAFQDLKNNFLNTVFLSHVMPNAQFKLQTDASNRGISAVLFQVDSEGNKYIISLVSRCLTRAEMQYTTTEKELLAIVYAVTKLRFYLMGNTFAIVTDHHCLTFLNRSVFCNARLMRWSLLLQQYSFIITYCKGTDNIVADFFSRNPDGVFHEEESDRLLISTLRYCLPDLDDRHQETALVLICRLDNDTRLKGILCDLSRCQRRDSQMMQILEQLDDGEIRDRYQLYKGILFIRGRVEEDDWRICVPSEMTSSLIDFIHHYLGHVGVYKTVTYLRRYFYWRSMSREVKYLIKTCDLCQRVKCINYSMQGEYEMVQAREPGDLVAVDFYGPLPRSAAGVQYIFVILDVFSKLVKLYPMKRANTNVALQRIFKDYVVTLGKPRRILSDHGSQFTSERWRNALECEGISVIFSSIRHPQSNPSERVMRELGRLFRTICSDRHTKWSRCVPRIEQLLNVTTHLSTGYAPIELHHGIYPKDVITQIVQFPSGTSVPHDLKIILARERMCREFKGRQKRQKSYSTVQLNVGDLVLLRVSHLSNVLDKVTRKFFHLYEGPYRISELRGNNAYVLIENSSSEIVKGTYNRLSLKPYYSREGHLTEI